MKVEFTNQEINAATELFNIAVKSVGLADENVIQNALHFKKKFEKVIKEELEKERAKNDKTSAKTNRKS